MTTKESNYIPEKRLKQLNIKSFYSMVEGIHKGTPQYLISYKGRVYKDEAILKDKFYTTIEQSKKLLELGSDPNTFY